MSLFLRFSTFAVMASLAMPVSVFAQDAFGGIPPPPTAFPGVVDSNTSVSIRPEIYPQPICPFPVPLAQGQTSDTVKELQDTLAQDPSVYPEGLRTGYYGPLTAAAVRRLQQSHNLPQTGVFDRPTIERLFPCIRLTVVSPNGREEWKKGGTYRITWQVVHQPYAAASNSLENSAQPRALTAVENDSVVGFYKGLRIDLIDGRGGVTHIGNSRLLDTAYSWTISNAVEARKDYRVRIALMHSLELWPSVNYYNPRVVDWSDNFFAITGHDLPPPPDDGVVNQLKTHAHTLLKQTESMIATLQTMLRLLEQL
jgi:peptidoglycan hydrolase-like protein with peptidoglycan-binding domain